jgi:hypothetical protein
MYLTRKNASPFFAQHIIIEKNGDRVLSVLFTAVNVNI